MASYRENYFVYVDDLFNRLKEDRFTKIIAEPVEQEIERPGSIQPVGWVKAAGPGTEPAVIIDHDGLRVIDSNIRFIDTELGTPDMTIDRISAGELNIKLPEGPGGYADLTLEYNTDTHPAVWLGRSYIGFGSGAASTHDVKLSRGAANRLDLASGDSLRIVSGNLEMGAASNKITVAGTPPSSPADDDLWYNTGSNQWGNEWFFYKSSIARWLTVAPRMHALIPDANNPVNTTWNHWGASELAWADIYVDAFHWSYFINGATNDATNHWIFRGYYSPGAGYVQIGSSQTTIGNPVSTWTRGYMTIQSIMAASTIDAFRFECFRNNAPSGLYCTALIKYRLAYQ